MACADNFSPVRAHWQCDGALHLCSALPAHSSCHLPSFLQLRLGTAAGMDFSGGMASLHSSSDMCVWPQLLMDIELLARADYFVGSWNSGMAVLVDALRYGRYGKDRCTALDASSARLDFCSRMRDFFLRPGPEEWAYRRRRA